MIVTKMCKIWLIVIDNQIWITILAIFFISDEIPKINVGACAGYELITF